jgi:hypothetical protein
MGQTHQAELSIALARIIQTDANNEASGCV